MRLDLRSIHDHASNHRDGVMPSEQSINADDMSMQGPFALISGADRRECTHEGPVFTSPLLGVELEAIFMVK